MPGIPRLALVPRDADAVVLAANGRTSPEEGSYGSMV
jgi:hypothetical protein